MEHLVRLWAHCQNFCRGERWKRADSDYVETVARWNGPPGEFFKAACEEGWIDEKAGLIVIHDWESINRRIVHNWKVGKLGGKPKGNPEKTQGKPKENPRVKNDKPKGNPRGIRSVTLRYVTLRTKKVEREEGDSRIQFGAINQQILRLEQMATRTPEQTADLKELRRRRGLLQKKQGGGDLTPLTKEEMEKKT